MDNPLCNSDSVFGIVGIWRTSDSECHAEGFRLPVIDRTTLMIIKQVVCVSLTATKAILCASRTRVILLGW